MDESKLRTKYELEVIQNPSNFEAVNFLAIWHLERQNYQQARQYFYQLSTVRGTDPNIWLCLSICCCFAAEYQDAHEAINVAIQYLDARDEDVRVFFCKGLLCQVKKQYNVAYDLFMRCLMTCDTAIANNQLMTQVSLEVTPVNTFLELRGEALLRIALIDKDIGAIEEAMRLCDRICAEASTASLSAGIGTRALCLKGLIHELRAEFPVAEIVYRSALQLIPDHALALERLGRLYLRFRETIPAAVQCFFKAVDSCPSNNIAWYLLGRCYSATGQYVDAGEAYNRSVNINPNDPNVWCSLGILYYATGQYRESLAMLSRAVKLDPVMANAWHNIGTIYEMCGQANDAKLAYEEASKQGYYQHQSTIGGNMSADSVFRANSNS